MSLLLYAIHSDSKVWDLRWRSSVSKQMNLPPLNVPLPGISVILQMYLWILVFARTQPRLIEKTAFHPRPSPTFKRCFSSLTKFHFNPPQLSVADVEALYKIYSKDFLMFGYSPQLYKDIASWNKFVFQCGLKKACCIFSDQPWKILIVRKKNKSESPKKGFPAWNDFLWDFFWWGKIWTEKGNADEDGNCRCE